MSFRPIYEGWDIPGRLSRKIRTGFAGIGLNRDLNAARELAASIEAKLEAKLLATTFEQSVFASEIATAAMSEFGLDDPGHRFTRHLTQIMTAIIGYEGWFALPSLQSLTEFTRSDLWKLEDHLKRVETIIDNLDAVREIAAAMLSTLVKPIVEQLPHLLRDTDPNEGDIRFTSDLRLLISDAPTLVEHMMHIPFAPDLESLQLTPRLQRTLDYNLSIASGGSPGDADSARSPKLPTRQSAIPDEKIAGV